MNESSLEEAFEVLIASAYRAAYGKAASEEWLLALSMRAGTKGTIATLDQAGELIGVTRERVRQVVAKVWPHMVGADIPNLAHIVESVARLSPVREPIGELLSQSGLVRSSLTGAAFLNLLKMLGTSPSELTGINLVRLGDWLVEESEVAVAKAVAVARRHTSSYGMTTVEEIRQVLASAENDLDPDHIRRILDGDSSVMWVGDWLWINKQSDGLHSNRLVNTARSILSVNSPQSVSSIHEGARRVWKFRQLDILPPTAAMKGFFEASPYFVVENDLVRPLEPLDYHDVLGGVAASMIDVLKSSPYQVMDRRSLHEACADAGIAKGTFGIWTTFAEWMERFAPSVWGLRGSKPSPAAVDAIRVAAHARRNAEPRRRSWEWAPDGAVVHTMDVTTSLMSTGVLSFEPEVTALLAGQSLGVESKGTVISTAKVGADHSFSWGWAPALTALGAKTGDVLQLKVQLASRRVDAILGGQELWGD